MSSAIFSILPVRNTSTVASARIARWLSNYLNVPFYDDGRIMTEGQLDNLFIVNGSTAFCKWLPELAQHVTAARNVIWVQNDYTLPPPKPQSEAMSPFRRAFADRGLTPHYWTTCRENSTITASSGWINWNVLGYVKNQTIKALDGSDFFYYGAYRKSRVKQFLYMAAAAGSVLVSSTSKQFRDIPGFALTDPIRTDLHRRLADHGLGIYAQDDKSTLALHCPATRFYEMLSAGLPMCFTPQCEYTLSQYDIYVGKYILTRENRLDLMEDSDVIGTDQRAMWVRDFEEELKLTVDGLYAKLD